MYCNTSEIAYKSSSPDVRTNICFRPIQLSHHHDSESRFMGEKENCNGKMIISTNQKCTQSSDNRQK